MAQPNEEPTEYFPPTTAEHLLTAVNVPLGHERCIPVVARAMARIPKDEVVPTVYDCQFAMPKSGEAAVFPCSGSAGVIIVPESLLESSEEEQVRAVLPKLAWMAAMRLPTDPGELSEPAEDRPEPRTASEAVMRAAESQFGYAMMMVKHQQRADRIQSRWERQWAAHQPPPLP